MKKQFSPVQAETSRLSRRRFIASTVKAGLAAAVFPAIVPASVFGKYAPSNRINVGAIGTGRISRIHDLRGIWKYDQARIIAVCDLDSNRVEAAKTLINDYYTKKNGSPYNGVQGYHDHQDRPGWLRCEQFGAGMITGWGAHHIDSAHWGMDTEYTGPVEVWGHADFPTKGLWDVHGIFRTEALYANGVRMVVSNELPNGIKFEGTKGWIFVTRGDYRVTASDPIPDANGVKPLDASDPAIIRSVIGPNELHLYVSEDQHGNWLDCITSRKAPITNAEIAHRACSTCLIHHIAMKLKRKVYWDPVAEKFKNDDDANRMLSRPQRAPYLVV